MSVRPINKNINVMDIYFGANETLESIDISSDECTKKYLNRNQKYFQSKYFYHISLRLLLFETSGIV